MRNQDGNLAFFIFKRELYLEFVENAFFLKNMANHHQVLRNINEVFYKTSLVLGVPTTSQILQVIFKSLVFLPLKK